LTWLGDGTGICSGYDLLGAFTGSEGTLGIVTKIVVKLMPVPEVVHLLLVAYGSTAEGGRAVSDIIAAGVLPAAIEMMDALAIEAAEEAVHCNYPAGAGAVLLVELDGPAAEVEAELSTVRAICEAAGATEIQAADDPAERADIWAGRKSAFAAVGRISPAYIVQDGVVPRTSLGAVLARIAELSADAGIRVANVFHAGDGNLHPLVLYDDKVPGQAEAAEKVSGAILDACLEHGGSITGEHGVGVDKSRYMPRMFGADDLDTMQLVRCAFDPASLCNPGKIFPTPRLCGEVPGRRRAPHPAVVAGQAEIFLYGHRTVVASRGPPGSCRRLPVAGRRHRRRRGGGGDPLLCRLAVVDREVSALLREAAAAGLAVVPRGAGTGLGWGAPPSRCDLVVDLRSMDQVVEHEAGDLVARVQAGATIGQLAVAFGSAGQQLALDVPAEATVGGVVATGTAGPRRFRYGAPRDLLIGITVVRADGVVAHAGGKVVKNVAGYDLAKLFAGSQGTLGVITEAAFRLHPLPAAVAWVTAEFGPAERAGAVTAVAAAAGSPLVPSAVELDWPGGSQRPLRVGVLLEGTGPGVAERAKQMSELLAAPGGAVSVAETAPARWGVLPSSVTVVRVSFWVSALGPVLDAVAAAGADAGSGPR
jgi:FAD/FMN-containing dehydrogenase